MKYRYWMGIGEVQVLDGYMGQVKVLDGYRY